MTIREEIDAQFPIRKTTAQKRAFEKWVMAKMREMGYRPYVDGMNRKDKLRHRNIVAGDPQNAELLISAHYDTAATIGVPDLRIPRNFPVYILSQGAVLLGMLLISLLIGTVVGLATKSGDWLILTFFFAYLALMLLMMFGAANKHNVNDNTSGIAAYWRRCSACLLKRAKRRRSSSLIIRRRAAAAQRATAHSTSKCRR